MARINIPQGQLRAASLTPSANVATPNAGNQAFNDSSQDVGIALQNLAGGGRRLGIALDRRASEERDAQVAERVAFANAQADPTPFILEAETKAAEDGSDLVELTREAYTKWLEDETSKIEDPDVRRGFRTYWLRRQVEVNASTATAAHERGLEYSNNQASDSLSALENKTRINFNEYGEALQLGNEILTSRPNLNTEASKRSWEQRLARSAFEGRIEQAQTEEDVDAIETDLYSDQWQSIFDVDDYDTTVDALNTRRSVIRRGTLAVARSQLTDLSKRVTQDFEFITDEEFAAVSDLVSQTGDGGLHADLARVGRQRRLLAAHRAGAPDDVRLLASRKRSQAQSSTSSLPELVGQAVETGSAFSNGVVSESYLSSLAYAEYGKHLKGDKIDYGKQTTSGKTTATGLYQFIETTWLWITRSNGDRIVEGAASMSDAELLEFRKDPVVSGKAAAAYAQTNKVYLESALGRSVDEYELHLAHVLGNGGALEFIKEYERDGDQLSVVLFPAATDNNPGLFQNKDGTSKTLDEAKLAAAQHFSSRVPSKVEYEDADFLERLANNMDSRIKDDLVTYGEELGLVDESTLSEEGGVQKRVSAIASLGSHFNIPANEVKPLKPVEAAFYKNLLADEDADVRLQVMSVFTQMGPVLAQQAFEQLGSEGSIYAHAAGLTTPQAGGNPQVAQDIVRGQTHLDTNDDWYDTKVAQTPALKKQDLYGVNGPKVEALIGGLRHSTDTGGAWQVVMDAAFAHFVQTSVRSPSFALSGGAVDDVDAAFMRSVDFVLGGSDGRSVVGDVNGPVLLPVGVDEGRLESWMDFATEEDWQQVAVSGGLPLYGNGDPVPLEELQNASLQAITRTEYRVVLDGGTLGTGKPNEVYTVVLDANTMKSGFAKVDAAEAAELDTLTEDEAANAERVKELQESAPAGTEHIYDGGENARKPTNVKQFLDLKYGSGWEKGRTDAEVETMFRQGLEDWKREVDGR